MKKYITLFGLVLFLAAAGYLAFAENTTETEPQEKPKKESSCCSSEHMGTDSFTENSLYQLNSKWKNQFNNDVELKDLKGKINVISMIFANCSYACPILVNDMRKIESALSKDELRNVQFTLISIDPERDTPKRLKQFAEDQNLNLARWKLLTGSRSDIDDFAVLLGFRYKKENDGSYSHSNIITILDEEGEVIHQHVGLNEDVTETISLIKEKVNKGV